MESIPEYILRQFELQPQKIHKLKNGSSNENWLCEDNGKQYIIKRSDLNVGSFDICYREWLNSMLVKGNIPIISDYRTIDNSWYVLYRESRWFARPYIEGRVAELNDRKDCLMCIEALAKIHGIIQAKPMCIRDFLYWNHEEGHKLNKVLKIMEKVLPRNQAKEMIKYYQNTINRVKTTERCFEFYEGSIIHGDYHGGNIIINNERISAIIDWDTSCLGSRIEDLAKGIYMLARKKHGEFELNEELAIELLSFYNNLAPISLDEMEMIPLYLETLFIPKPEYLNTFKTLDKLEWYLHWTFMASQGSHCLNKIINTYMEVKL